jgi:hypothetical protein
MMWLRKIECFVYGHELRCWIPAGSARWLRPGHGWCAYCARHVKVPARAARRINVVSFIKTLLHCLWMLTKRPFPSTLANHTTCSDKVYGTGDERYFCSCGYLNNGFTFQDIIESRVPKCVECGSNDDILEMLECPTCFGPVCMTCAQLFHDCVECEEEDE